MKRLWYSCFLPLLTVLVWGQGTPHGKPSLMPNESERLVSALYKQVITRRPLGIPSGADMRAFAPYLSKALRYRFDLNKACAVDWRKQNPDPSLKPPVGLIENGIFSGANEEAEPQAFYIERTESENDGSSRVYVRLTVGDPPNRPLVWYVAAVVVREDGRPFVDDVLYLKGENGEVESRLSRDLSSGCDGPRWVGETRPR
jgi:hypothetical protein